MKKKFALALHGGAGNLIKMNLTPEKEKEYSETITMALDTGYKLLEEGFTCIDAVEAVIKILEDSPLFNAGKGSVFTNDGTNEMDAAIMNGKNLQCGAVCNIRTIKNPISAARKVMDKSSFVLLSGKGAEKFAHENNIEIVDTSYFFEQYRWDQMLKIRDTTGTQLDNDGKSYNDEPTDHKFGTVGCVALDRYGNIAAGTSTGGLVNKKYNRIGDSPLIGSGTFADNGTCAVSCTGRGEDFIRIVAAHQLSSLIRFKPISLKKAAKIVIHKQLKSINGRGGLVAINRRGKIVFSFNTSGMFRGYKKSNNKQIVAIYK